jgi:Protein of unknown function (DUF998)
MKNSHQPISQAAALRARRGLVPGSALHRLLLGCGVLGSLLFTGTFLAEGATRAGYDPWRQPISALSLGPGGWLQSVNFVVFGLLMACFALGRSTPSHFARGYWRPPPTCRPRRQPSQPPDTSPSSSQPDDQSIDKPPRPGTP